MQPLIQPTPQTRKSYVCLRAASAPHLDGRLDKPFWHHAPWTDDFVDIEGDGPPAHRPRPRFRTRVKMLWDDEHFYIGAEMEEPHVWGTLTQRDSIIFHDNDFEVFLNPSGDSHTYYELEVNALNTVWDLFLPKPYKDGGPADHHWHIKGLRTAVHVDGTLNNPRDTDRGWSVEIAMPWRAFDKHPSAPRRPVPGEHWRVNFSRVEWDHIEVDGHYAKVQGRPEHNWVWSPQGVIDMHRPEQWGFVQFSPRASDPEPFIPDPTLPARDLLHAVYYAQHAHHRAHARWSRSIDDLRPWLPEGFPHDPEIFATPSGWTASASVGAGPLFTRVAIRHDGLITTDAASV